MTKEMAIYTSEDVKNKIHTIRGLQVMLDSDLAEFYGVETKVLNQAVMRNIERFPEEFMFKLTDEEYNSLRSQIATLEPSNLKSQIVTSSSNPLRSQIVTLEPSNLRSQFATSSWGGRRKKPYAFTEQGVAMLSGVLKSDTAVKVSIQIINAFVNMRRFISANAQVFKRLDTLETKQIETDKKIDVVLNAIESKQIRAKQGIFYDGQVFDAYKFVSDLIRTAHRSIVIIDNYVDDTVLTLLSKRKKGVSVIILTRTISKQLLLDVKKYNEQYPTIIVKEFNDSHDRFIIIDDKTIYHFGASLKDLGKKWFAFSKLEKETFSLIKKLEMLK